MDREQIIQSLTVVLGDKKIRDVMVKEDRVSLTILLTSNQENEKDAIKQLVEQHLKEYGISDAHIRFSITQDAPPVKEHVSSQKEVTQPVKGSDVLNSGAKFLAVASGKGGVGKSTVTVNLAIALARLGNKVGLIDADIYGFSVPDMLGVEGRPEVINEKVQPIERFGIKMISMGCFVEDNAPVVWRGPMIGKMLRNFLTDVNWGELDYVLLDLPPGTGDMALDVHQMIPQSKFVLVTTPHPTAAFVAARAGSMAIHTKHEILGIVENMSYVKCESCGTEKSIFGKGGGAKLAEELHAELLAQIPLGLPDYHPLDPESAPSVYAAEHQIGKVYLELAERISEKMKTSSVID